MRHAFAEVSRPGNTITREPATMQKSWDEWRQELVALLEEDLEGTSTHLAVNETDWNFWRTLFLHGRSPRSALDHVLGRDL